MNEVASTSKGSISAYRIFGWVPLLVTVIGATSVVIVSVLRDL